MNVGSGICAPACADLMRTGQAPLAQVRVERDWLADGRPLQEEGELEAIHLLWGKAGPKAA